jgi:bifunctional non-homologous end joining protein LigD
LHEIKLDGFRLMARRDAAGVRLLTRNGLDWSSRYPAHGPVIDRKKLAAFSAAAG